MTDAIDGQCHYALDDDSPCPEPAADGPFCAVHRDAVVTAVIAWRASQN